MTLSGIFKSILLVVIGVLVWGTPIGALQLVGYLLALFGLFLYSVPSHKILEYVKSMKTRLAAFTDDREQGSRSVD